MSESERTPFAGFELLLPGASLAADGFAFQAENPAIADGLAKLGALLHRHDEHAGLVKPATPAALTLSATGGSFPSGIEVFVGYTLTDAYGGETMLSPIAKIATGEPFPDPTVAPTAAPDLTKGSLLAASYDYALTCTDGKGGESAIGPAVEVVIPPGYAKAQVVLSKLGVILKEVAKGAEGAEWRLWRIANGSEWSLLATGLEAAETLTDDGTHAPDCNVSPPEENNSVGANKVTIEVPNPELATVSFFSVYACIDEEFKAPCLVGVFPIAEVTEPIVLEALSVTNGQPPAVSRSYPGAKKIDPDKDMVAFPWKRPVNEVADLPTEGNTDGDVREVLEGHALYVWSGGPEEWVPLSTIITKTFRTVHSFVLQGEVTVKAYPGLFVSKAALETVKLVKVTYGLESGTEAEFRIQRNGADIAGFGTEGAPLVAVSTEATAVTPTGVALSEDDLMTLVLSGVVGAPVGLAVTLAIEHTV